MTNRELRELYKKAEKGDARASARLSSYLQRTVPIVNKRLSRIEERGLKSDISSRTSYYAGEYFGGKFTASLSKIMAAGDGLTTLGVINKFYESGVTARSIARQQNRYYSSLRKNYGLVFTKEEKDIISQIFSSEEFKDYVDFDSDSAVIGTLLAVQSGKSIKDFQKIMNKINLKKGVSMRKAWNEWIKL